MEVFHVKRIDRVICVTMVGKLFSLCLGPSRISVSRKEFGSNTFLPRAIREIYLISSIFFYHKSDGNTDKKRRVHEKETMNHRSQKKQVFVHILDVMSQSFSD